ncbi:hypothetical protein EOA32_14340 [Mesorhizobium sp. M1A.F.Ca.ET.072.01.1.1]|nr:hypothetical protein EOA32_14340 [Mesorhizobium sp. M1A.F.Ca.ET.072.01.1.1]TIV03858.1 MAG: hypothetical protein E5W04_06310 [Mesorhizobium sp.]
MSRLSVAACASGTRLTAALGAPPGSPFRPSGEREARGLIKLIGTDWNSLVREAKFLKLRHLRRARQGDAGYGLAFLSIVATSAASSVVPFWKAAINRLPSHSLSAVSALSGRSFWSTLSSIAMSSGPRTLLG